MSWTRHRWAAFRGDPGWLLILLSASFAGAVAFLLCRECGVDEEMAAEGAGLAFLATVAIESAVLAWGHWLLEGDEKA